MIRRSKYLCSLLARRVCGLEVNVPDVFMLFASVDAFGTCTASCIKQLAFHMYKCHDFLYISVFLLSSFFIMI